MPVSRAAKGDDRPDILQPRRVADEPGHGGRCGEEGREHGGDGRRLPQHEGGPGAPSHRRHAREQARHRPREQERQSDEGNDEHGSGA